MNNQRFRLTAEICYCSTLAECRDPARRRVTAGTTNETSRCRSPWDITFQQESAQRRSRRALFEHLARRCLFSITASQFGEFFSAALERRSTVEVFPIFPRVDISLAFGQ